MRLATLCLTALLASPAHAQTSNDDMSSTENWWDDVGAAFFANDMLNTPQPEFDIRAHWTALSADDQAAIRARCLSQQTGTDIGALSMDEGDEDNAPDTPATDLADTTADGDAEAAAGTVTDQPADAPGATAAAQGLGSVEGAGTTVTGSLGGVERQVAAPAGTPQPAPDAVATNAPGLHGVTQDGAPRLVSVCALIPNL